MTGREIQDLAFKAAEVSAILGVASRTVSSWVSTVKILTPSVRPGKGPAQYRLFSFGDLVKMRVFMKLRERARYPAKLISDLLEMLEFHDYDFEAAPPPLGKDDKLLSLSSAPHFDFLPARADDEIEHYIQNFLTPKTFNKPSKPFTFEMEEIILVNIDHLKRNLLAKVRAAKGR